MIEKTKQPVVIVSGLPRSGTSLMMSMLQAGGIQLLSDQIRKADEDNPKGYHEFERSKALKDGDLDWVESASGQAVKVISALLRFLPADHHYKVIFMQRDLQEVLNSQRQMLIRRKQNPESISDAEMTIIYKKHLAGIKEWLRLQANFDVLEISYNLLFVNPKENLERISIFLEREIDTDAMQAVIDVNLYRQRNSNI